MGPVRVRALRATIWHGSESEMFEALGSSDVIDTLARALDGGHPLWLELTIDRDPEGWFEGGLTPWSDAGRPELDWSEVEGLRDALIQATPLTQEAHRAVARRLLDVLPHVYALGVERAAVEVFEFRQAAAQRQLFETASSERFPFEMLPTVGFNPIPHRDKGVLPELHAIRMAVGRVGKLVVSVRLPDIPLRPGEPPNGLRTKPLHIPARFFPHNTQPNGEGMVGAIVRHQAATARVVAEEMRKTLAELRELALTEPKTKPPPTTTREWVGAVFTLIWELFNKPKERRDPPLLEAREAADRLWQMGEVVHEVERQIARLLRRFAGTVAEPSQTLRERELRYHFALDEVRAVHGDIRLDRDAVANEFAAREQSERERFQFVAAALGGIILVPTLIAALYGANVKFPGKDTPGGFLALGLAILAFAGAGWITISEFWVRGWVPQSHQRSRRLQVWLVVILAVGAIVFTVLAAVFGILGTSKPS